MPTLFPPPRALALLVALAALSAAPVARAAACDSAVEAWSAAGAAMDALARGDNAAARTLSAPLLARDCAPPPSSEASGANSPAALLRRAVLEARLVHLEASARTVRARLLRSTLAGATFADRAQFETWTVRVLFPLARRIERAVAREVMPEATALLRDSRDAPAVRADAAAVVAELSTAIAALVHSAPRPGALENDPDFATAYREALEQVARPWTDAARDACNLSASLSRTAALEPRAARRAAAALALRAETP